MKRFAWLALPILLGCGLYTFALMVTGPGWVERLPRWDQAGHALDAIHFARSIRQLDALGFLEQLNASAMYPPLVPLLQTPFLLAAGEHYSIVRSWTAVIAVLCLGLAFWVGMHVRGAKTHGSERALVGAWAAGLLAVSPIFLEHAQLEMLEVPGVFFTLLTVGFYMQYLQAGESKHWRRTAQAGLLLWFCKYNYAIQVLAPILIFEGVRHPEIRRTLIAFAQDLVRRVSWRAPFTLFVLLYAAALFYIERVGLQFEAFGHVVRVRRAFGNPLYFLFLIVLIKLLIWNRSTLKIFVSRIRAWPEPLASGLRWLILPIALWLAYPPFFSTFFRFVFNESNRSAPLFSEATLGFYPRAFLDLFTPSPLIGYLCGLSGLTLLFLWRIQPTAVRFLLALTLFDTLLTMAHPTLQPRFLLTTAPLIFLLPGLAMASLLSAGSRFPALRQGGMIAGCLLGLSLPFVFAGNRNSLDKSLIENSNEPELGAVYAAICDKAVRVARSSVLGFDNELSPAGVGLACYDHHPEIKRSQLPVSLVKHGFHGETDGALIVRARRIDLFFEIDRSQRSNTSAKLHESELLTGVRAELAQNSGYARRILLDQGPGGFRVWVWQRVEGRPESGPE